MFLPGRREAGDAGVRRSADGSVVFAAASVVSLPCHLFFDHCSLRGQGSKFGRDYKDVLRVVLSMLVLSSPLGNRLSICGGDLRGQSLAAQFLEHRKDRAQMFVFGFPGISKCLQRIGHVSCAVIGRGVFANSLPNGVGGPAASPKRDGNFP